MPKFITFLVALFFYCQIIFSSIWPYTAFFRLETNVNSNVVIGYETQIFWFLNHEISFESSYASFLTCLVVFIICFAWFLFIATFYHLRRRYMKWTLYPTRVIIEIIAPIFLHPSTAAAGSALLTLMNTKTALSWVFFVIGVIIYVCFLFIFLTGYSFMCNSAILVTTLYTAFDPTFMKIMSITSSLMVFLSFLFYNFEGWVTNILQIVHFAIFLYLFIQVFQIKFHSKVGNYLVFSFVLTSLLCDLLLLICNLAPTILFGMIPIFVSIIAFVLFYVIGIFVIKATFKKVANQMKYDIEEDEEVTAEFQSNLFRSLRIDTSRNKALLYLRIGLVEMTEPFTDWSLVKFIIANYADDQSVLCPVIQILSFFPCQQQLLNGCFVQVLKKKKLNLGQRFLIYQAYRIKTMRQSSIPLEANERMLHLRLNTRDCEFAIKSVWGSKVTPSIGLFETINSMTEKTDGLWQEGIRDYPNNSKISEDYCRFLTECRMDFKGAVVQKQRIDMIDNGHNFSRDYSFRSFVQNFPLYLKKNLVDTSGNMIRKNRHTKGTNSSNSSHSKQTYSTSGSLVNIDFELEMMQARVLFSQSKLRMALYNALKNTRLMVSNLMIVTAIISFVVCVICFVVMDILIKQWLYERSLDSANSEKLTNSFFYMNVASLNILIEFMMLNNRFLNMEYMMEFRKVESNLTSYIVFGIDMRPDLIKNMIKSQNYFEEFLNEISNQASSGLNVYDMALSLFKPRVPGIVCWHGRPTNTYNRSMKDSMTDLFYDFNRLQAFPSDLHLYMTDPYCEIPTNMILIGDPLRYLLENLHSAQVNSSSSFNANVNTNLIIIPTILLIMTLIPFLIVGIVYSMKMKKFASLLIGLDPKTKEGCKKPILVSSDQQNDVTTSDHIEVGHKWLVNMFIHVFFSILAFIVIFIMIYRSSHTNNILKKINDWQYLSSMRFIYSIELTHIIWHAVILNGSFESRTLSQKAMANVCNRLITNLKAVNTLLLKGSANYQSCVGFDRELDEINTKEQCNLNETNETESIHDLYRCASANQAINVFADIVQTVTTKIESYGGKIEDPILINLIHLANAHLWHHLSLGNSRLLELILFYYQDYSDSCDVYMLCGIIVGFIILVFQIYCSIYSHKLYHVGLSLVRRIPLQQFVANKTLLNFVLNRKSVHMSSITCTSQSVIMHSNDGMIGVNNEGIIEIINPAVTTILGYTPDQLLGQPITEIFKPDDGEHIAQQMKSMSNGQGLLINEKHLICISDNANEVPCHIFIIGLKGKTHSVVESYAFLCRDESSLVEQQTAAEEAKAQSEKLLFQILPRNIVTKLNRGEHDISFSVPSASIIFTDIVRFSDYSSNLSPSEVMGNLSQIFASFDEAVKQHTLITKIKLIGDIYMAAAGLFSEEGSNPSLHAEQTVKFGLDCLQCIEDMNIKLDANLQLRIGVNSGGPLYAGVLGSDKPVFDIIGDPINVAARLQTTDLPGRIQIPQSTYDLIAQCGFLIEQRGEVFLKGKGKTVAYFVNPMSATFASMSEEQMTLTSNDKMKTSSPFFS
ncbi:Adenylate and Guanylate cyclase catalytic domain containing protein [Tritrichomonas foetus]|uniref:Adenylate and Guanylate cyclase catalytic domain containing protein n=1 Tax=Tritrichomonas foetus TaxID=1144522 RepID=A0A1J4KN96_9EUKA|nr:Adenylate and Guanylate cyclase catalytic domain containing protein [Tritrichomonas foetus]|eukprot:OHT12376.1 Adenylate and Guanylate cyclase catalytic domain containing protein [Tritrichomonas foetus]